MSDAPKSIWAWEHTDPETGKPFGYGEWYTEDVGLDGDETEYVRCDELDRLRAENERLREALEKADVTIKTADALAEAVGLVISTTDPRVYLQAFDGVRVSHDAYRKSRAAL